MKQAKIADLKNNLSRYLAHVREGAEVLVLDRDTPVARLVPIGRTEAQGAGDLRLGRLEQRGLARRGSGGRPPWLGRRKPGRVAGGVLRTLLAEREEGW